MAAWVPLMFIGYVIKKVCDTAMKYEELNMTNQHNQAKEIAKDPIDKFPELPADTQNNDKDGKIGLLASLKTATLEEREEVRKQLRIKSDAEYDATVKSLRDSLDKIEKRNIQLAQELQEATNKGDTGQVAKVATMMRDMEKQQSIVRLNLQKAEKAKKENQQIIDKHVQNVDKAWYRDMNFKSPWLWVLLLISCVLSYFLYRGFTYIWNKTKELFFSE